ncbi:MAG: flagellar basal body L-ring protein FlgH [Planctomycetes bacterium]|nr:flagellar basal body L-ring protein FlgH [Planctomycetota bacterium]
MRRYVAILSVVMLFSGSGLSAQALWRTAAPKASWYTPVARNQRVWKVHDHVMIRIDHNANATRDDRFESRKEYEANATLADFVRFGRGINLNPSDKPELTVDFDSELSSRDEGRRRRRSTFTDIVTAEITEVMPNYDAENNRGLLMIRAVKEVRVGGDVERIELTGRVEAAHIDEFDTIDLERVAFAEVNYYGDGDVSDSASMGWLAKILSSLWPF